MSVRFLTPVLLGIALASAGVAQAQVSPRLDSLPGALLNTQPASPFLENNPQPSKDSPVENTEAEKSLKATVHADKQAIRIHVKKIEVTGSTRLSPEEIKVITGPFENRASTLDELEKGVVQPLLRLYEQKGFVTALVSIPPQKLADGTLTVQADEGTLSEVVYEGEHHFKSKAILPRINLKPGEPFNLHNLQTSLRRINENPDIYLQATLRAGEKPGETQIVLRSAEEHFPIHIAPSFDNLGRAPIGNNRLGLTLTHNNVLGFGDTVNSSFSLTNHSRGNSSNYELPLGKHGTKLGFNYAFNGFNFDQSSFNFKGQGSYYTPYISQEIRRTDKSVLTAELGLGVKNSTLDLEGLTLNEDRIRVLTPAITWIRNDKNGRTILRAETGIGLNLFGATDKDSVTSSRPGAGSQFWRLTGYAVRAQKLPWNTYGIFKAIGQATPSSLVSMEQFQIGGASTVRGYKQGRLIGDSGFALNAEWHVPIRFLPEHIKFFRWQVPLKNQLELVSFLDFGGVFDNNAFSGVNAQSNRVISSAVLGSFGLGLRANITKRLAARLDLGFPYLKLVGDTSRRPMLHFGLESRLF